MPNLMDDYPLELGCMAAVISQCGNHQDLKCGI